MAQDPNKYFAASEAENCAATLLNKASSFYRMNVGYNAYLTNLQKMYRAYYGQYNNGYGENHEISFAGEQGELVQLPVNHFRNLGQNIHVMVTSSRPVMQAQAINTDYKSQSQAYLANGILEYYMRQKDLESCLRDAAEQAIVLGASFVKMEWNATGGKEYDVDPDSGEFNYEGELEFTVLSPLDVVFDGTKERWENEWLLTRSFVNKFNLMAKYPELAEKIANVATKTEVSHLKLSVWSNDDTDDIPVYEFFHERTEAVPDGRYMLFLDSDIVLLDTRLPYREIPVYRISAGNIMGTPYGYSSLFDIFPLQEMVNSTHSAIASNQTTFGVQNVWVPPGSDLVVESLSGGMNVVKSTVKPESLNLTETPAELFKSLELYVRDMETLSGVSSVSRGAPQASLESGTALAMVQAMSLQFQSGLQHSYVKLIEDVGTGLLNILKDFATSPKVVALVGKNNKTYLKEFVGEDISAIHRVIVDVGNPLAKTTAGRVQMAEQLAQMKLIKNPAQYFQVITTGRLDPVYEGDMGQLLLMQRENEKLMESRPVLVAPTDLHAAHIEKHSEVLNDPELREDPAYIKNVMDHIQAHMDALRNTDPDLLMVLRQQPLPPVPSPQPESLDPNAAPPGAQPLGNKDNIAASANTDLMQGQQGLAQEGDVVVGPNGQGTQLPGLPSPPGQFETLPVLAQDVVPS